MGCLLSIIWLTPTASIPFIQTLHTYKSHQNSLAGAYVGAQLNYIVSPYRYVNIQSVFW